MKHRSIASSLATMSLGALLSACGGAESTNGSELSEDDVASDDAMSNFDEVDLEVTACDDSQYDHWKYLSALAVATANELGRWNAAKDFYKENTWSNPRILLSAEGLARCNPSGCPNVSALLQMQNMETATITRHDPLLLRQYMVAFHDRQKGSPAPEHSLTLVGTSPDVCGLRYTFDVSGAQASTSTTSTSGVSGTSEFKATSAYKCLDIVGVSGNDGAQAQQYSCSGGANQRFTVEASGSNYRLKANHSGKCLGVVNSQTSDGALLEQRSCGANGSQLFQLNAKGAGLFELKNVNSGKCVDIQNGGSADGQRAQLYSCHGGANQRFQASGLITGSSTTTSNTSSVTPSSLWSQLKFAGQNENKYLMFQSNATQVSIDPMGTMVSGGASATSGACLNGPTVYSPTNISGNCCTLNGRHGGLRQSSFSAKWFECKH